MKQPQSTQTAFPQDEINQEDDLQHAIKNSAQRAKLVSKMHWNAYSVNSASLPPMGRLNKSSLTELLYTAMVCSHLAEDG